MGERGEDGEMNYLKGLPEDILELLRLSGRVAEGVNYRAYVVGGFVRDIMLKVDNFDIDIVIEGDGIIFAGKLARFLKGDVVKHRRFGTATITLPDKRKIDIATARKEIYNAPAELPVVSPGDIEADLARRDFTINAMAVGINNDGFGRLRDFFEGERDLKKGLMRVLHKRSFIDDPTRILRAVRFEQRYDFRIETRTLRLLSDARRKKLLEVVQKHRVREELVRMLKDANPAKCLKRLAELYGFSFLHPGLTISRSQFELMSGILSLAELFKQRFPFKRRLDVWLMYLMVILRELSPSEIYGFGRDFALRKGEVKRLKSGKTDIIRIEKFLSKNSGLFASSIYKKLQPFSYEVILLAYLSAKSLLARRRIMDFLTHYNELKLSISGNDLLDLGASAGPRFKKILNDALFAKINGRVKTKDDELAYVVNRVRGGRLAFSNDKKLKYEGE